MGTVSRTLEPPPLYRPRNARASPLYRLFETYYEDVKAVWEERFREKIRFLERLRRHRGRSLPRLWNRRRGFRKTQM